MLGWFTTWKQSHLDTRFFRRAPQYSAGFFALYLVSMYLIFSIINTALFAFRTLPTWTQDSTQLWADLQKNWPENASLAFENNVLQLNGVDELVLPLPQHLANRYKVPSNVLVASESLLTASESATPAAFIATPNSINIWNPDGSYRAEAWANLGIEDFVWNKASFAEHTKTFTESQKMLSWFSVISFFLLSWFGILAIRVLALLFYAWVGQTLLWFSGNRLKFGNTYKIGLFLLPIAEEILLVAKILYPDSHVLSFWLIWFVVLAAIAFTNRSQLGSAE